MITVVLLGAGFGFGLFLLLRIIAPPRLPLAAALARVDAGALSPANRSSKPRTRRPTEQLSRLGRRIEALEWLLGERFAGQIADRGLLEAGLRADLALLGRDERAYTARKLVMTLGALVVLPVLLVPVAALLALPWLAGAVFSVLFAAAVFAFPDARVRRAARARREEFATAIAAYLDLVAMRAASGAGVPEALRAAANVGNGRAFVLIREALDDARMSGQLASRALGMLGEDLDVVELRQLAAQLQLTEESGAQAEESLRAKAEALRSRQLSDAQGGANARSQTMLLGQVLLGLGFLIFLGYPAIAQVLTI